MVCKQVPLHVANAFVIEHHRHNDKVLGCKFCIGAFKDDKMIGVAIVGRPVSRYLDDGNTLEVTRLCTDGTRNACSFLYGRSARKAKEMGYKKIQTYILVSEPGTSLRAAGWFLEADNVGGLTEWHPKKPIQQSLFETKKPKGRKQRWAKILT